MNLRPDYDKEENKIEEREYVVDREKEQYLAEEGGEAGMAQGLSLEWASEEGTDSKGKNLRGYI